MEEKAGEHRIARSMPTVADTAPAPTINDAVRTECAVRDAWDVMLVNPVLYPGPGSAADAAPTQAAHCRQAKSRAKKRKGG